MVDQISKLVNNFDLKELSIETDISFEQYNTKLKAYEYLQVITEETLWELYHQVFLDSKIIHSIEELSQPDKDLFNRFKFRALDERVNKLEQSEVNKSLFLPMQDGLEFADMGTFNEDPQNNFDHNSIQSGELKSM